MRSLAQEPAVILTRYSIYAIIGMPGQGYDVDS